MKNLLIIIVFTALFGCIKEEVELSDIANLTNGEAEIKLVIDGYLTSELSVQRVKLSTPSKIDEPNKFVPITTAEVSVTDGETTYLYHVSDSSDVYQSNVLFKGVVGKVYTLTVLYNDNYYTASDSMVINDSMMNFSVKNIRSFDSHIEINYTSHNFGFSKPAIWTSIESPIGSENIFPHIELNFFDTRFFFFYNHVGSIPQGIFATGSLSSSFSGSPSDSLEIIKMSVSETYYDYLVSRFNITEWSSGIFSTIPGNTKTNVSEGGTGYFYCTDVQRNRMTFKDLKEKIENDY